MVFIQSIKMLPSHFDWGFLAINPCIFRVLWSARTIGTVIVHHWHSDYGPQCPFTLVFFSIQREHRIPKEGLKREQHSRFDMGPMLFVIVCGKRKVEMIRSLSAFWWLKLSLWFHVAPDIQRSGNRVRRSGKPGLLEMTYHTKKAVTEDIRDLRKLTYHKKEYVK